MKHSHLPTNNTFTDPRDGNVYRTITIGNQIWMAQNLKYLPSVVGPKIGSNTIPYCYVNDYNGTNVVEAKATAIYMNYGVLYNWEAARAFCPSGWHLPSVDEWKQLIDKLGGQRGFVPFPGGLRDHNVFELIGFSGNWWTANNSYIDFDPTSFAMLFDPNLYTPDAWYLTLSTDTGYFNKLSTEKGMGLSVRCIRD